MFYFYHYYAGYNIQNQTDESGNPIRYSANGLYITDKPIHKGKNWAFMHSQIAQKISDQTSFDLNKIVNLSFINISLVGTEESIEDGTVEDGSDKPEDPPKESKPDAPKPKVTPRRRKRRTH